jgi:PleD family two-component response regulator
LNPENELNLAHEALAKKYFQQADLAMYQAKQLGRNQSFIWKDY